MKDLLKVITKIGEITFRALWLVWLIVIVGISVVTYICVLPFAYLTHDDELLAQIVYTGVKATVLPDKLVKGAYDIENVRSPINGRTVKEMIEEIRKDADL